MINYMEFPSLRGRDAISIDLETHDPDLKTKGIGVRRGGYPVGYAVASKDTEWYFPVAHENSDNYPAESVETWLRDELKEFKGELIFANGLYDLDYMAERGIHVPSSAKIRDIQIAEPLIDDNKFKYNLDTLGEQYCGRGKNEAYLIDLFGKDFKKKMEQIPAELAADYAKEDVRLTYDIYQFQKPRLRAEKLWRVFELESDLTPMMLYMRRLGVRIDAGKADERAGELYLKQKRLERELEDRTGVPFYSDRTTSVWKSSALALAFDGAGLEYPRTPITKAPSFRKQWLEQHGSDLAEQILQIRKYDKTRGTFLNGALLGNQINGRIHTTFNQVRNDEGGAITGRFSSCHPNLQQAPSRDEETAPIIRSLFLPEEGCDWFCYDWSQIEYRLLVHYAALMECTGARRVLQKYIENPATDYHAIVQALVKESFGKDVSRGGIKGVNFGLIYGMGKAKLGRMLAMDIAELESFLDAYNSAIPFADEMRKEIAKKASRTGFIETIFGRRRRFDRWESTAWDEAKEDGAMPEEEALAAYGGRGSIRRAGTYKALNSLIQGSAADLMKEAMRQIWQAGLTGALAIHLTVHDELDGSVPRTPEGQEALLELKHIMETAIPLLIPIRAEGGIGPNWAEAK